MYIVQQRIEGYMLHSVIGKKAYKEADAARMSMTVEKFYRFKHLA